MSILPYWKLKRYSDTALFFGCGPSINDITEDDYEILKQYDKWAINFFLLHDFIIPDYYFRSLRKKDVNFPLFRRLWNEREEYRNVKFLTDCTLSRVHEIETNERYFLKFHRSWKQFQGDYQRQLEDFRILKDAIYFYGRSSLCALLTLMYQIGYKEIIIYGNDLTSKDYFWSNDKTKKVHWRWVKQSKGEKRKGDHPNIESVTTFVPFFSREYMNNRIFAGSKQTPLYPGVPYKSIEELK